VGGLVVVVEVVGVGVVVIGPVVDGFSPDGSELPVPGLVELAPDSGEVVAPEPLWDCGTGLAIDGSEPEVGPVWVADPEFELPEVGLSVWETTGREGATTFPSSAPVEDGGVDLDRAAAPAVGTCTEPGNVTFAVESDPCAALTMARVPMIATTPGTAHQGPFTGFPWGRTFRPTTARFGNRTGPFAS
jgi:hypothetical protein